MLKILALALFMLVSINAFAARTLVVHSTVENRAISENITSLTFTSVKNGYVLSINKNSMSRNKFCTISSKNFQGLLDLYKTMQGLSEYTFTCYTNNDLAPGRVAFYLNFETDAYGIETVQR